ncbi:MAG: CoA-binding protein [Deltaproteobacteria bacterium]|nr:CoA-binding protein [Deltaproteobacteria bacterium]
MSSESSNGLERLFYPKSVAVVGATPKKGKEWSTGNAYIAGLIEQDFQGKIYPVHPRAEYILGYKCYGSIREIPDQIDLVIFTVPSRVALQVMEDCVSKKVKFVHLLTAGFSETGYKEHADLEKRLVAIAKKGNVRLVGPNCMGLYCPEGGIAWTSDFPNVSGPVGIFSQSGQLAHTIVMMGALQRLRFSKVVSFGNACDLQAHDFLNYLAGDEKTKFMGTYIEGLKDGKAFFDAARDITRTKPLVVWKGGETEGGSRAVLSHTAAIAGSQEVWRGLCRQAGIIPVASVDEMTLVLSALQRLPLPRGRNVAVLGGAGGGSVTMTDVAEREGLKVPRLSQETIRALEAFIPLEGSSTKNPLDILPALANKENILKLFTLLRDDPNIDALVFNMPIHFLVKGMGRAAANKFLQLTVQAAELLKKPMLVVLEGARTVESEVIRQESEDWCHEAGMATFPTFELAARVMNKLNDYRDYVVSHG